MFRMFSLSPRDSLLCLVMAVEAVVAVVESALFEIPEVVPVLALTTVSFSIIDASKGKGI